VVTQIIAASSQTQNLLAVEAQDGESIERCKARDGETSGPGSPSSTPSSPGSPADRRASMGSTTSTAQASVRLPLAHTCFLGMLQRITLSPPDRAPVRQVLQASLVDLLTTLGQELRTRDALPEPSRAACLKAVLHYLEFLSKLSRSSKVAHRAFSLDITAQLLSAPWLWDLPRGDLDVDVDEEEETVASPCVLLLDVLQERCLDASPAVRTRALGAISDLLLNLNEDSSHAMMVALFDAAMGGKPAGARSADASLPAKLSLIDTLRERAADDKPQVRTKALQALGAALSMSWPRVGGDGAVTVSNMLVTEDDLQVFASHCQDSSLSTRKQALQSLTDLLTSRPADALIQDMWVQSVLPMTFDAEASVTNKVAENLHTLLFNNLMAWYVDQQSTASTRSQQQDQASLERQQYHSLVWKLTAKITAMGMFKILKASVGIMLKQSLLAAASPIKSDTRPSSVLAVIAALKVACCCHLDGANEAGVEKHSQSVQTFRDTEPDEVARSAWILLESLVSLEGTTILNAKQESIKFRDFIRQAGSADFVVRCYRQKHASDAHVVWDEEDLRIFKVLEILGANLTPDDTVFVRSQMVENLQQLDCPCHVAAAAIGVLLQLSKTEALSGLDAASQQASKALQASVLTWVAPLQSAIYGVLHMYALRTRAPVTKGESLGALSPVVHVMLDWLQEGAQTAAQGTLDVSAVGEASTAGESLTAHVLEIVQTALFVLGEVSMLGFSMEEDHFLGTESKKGTNSSVKSAEQFRLPVNEAVVELVKIMMGHTLPMTEGAVGVQRECPSKIRANAFVTMGKLCMRNKSLARAHVNIYLREVSQKNTGATVADSLNVSSLSAASHVSAAAAVRSNALLVLGDMCIRYTNLVDRHVDTMAQCLQDSDAMVRKNALVLLTQLLLQDFLKWKGFLLYRFLVLTVDPDFEIAEFSRNILQRTLGLKYPQLLTSHFTEALVILNACTAHPAYASIARTGTASSDGGITEAGPPASAMDTEAEDCDDLPPADVAFTAHLTKAQRFGVYAFMAENMDDETKIQVSAKLVQDILTAAVDSATLLPQPNQKGRAKAGDREKYTAFENVLEDALTLLRSPHLKVFTAD
jgi:hypothetical protein